MTNTFDITNLDYLISQNPEFEISKVYNIGLQRYRKQKIRVCDKIQDTTSNDSSQSWTHQSK